jgi:hypothetical protein
MLDTIYMSLVIIAFFALVIHAIHKEEQRKADRRRQNRPVPVERRHKDRRKKSMRAYLLWAVRAQKARWGK